MDALGEDHKDLDDFGLVDALSALSKVPVPVLLRRSVLHRFFMIKW